MSMELTVTRKQEILDRLGGDEQLLREIVQMYLEDFPVLLEQLETALDHGNATTVTRAAHDLKGLLSNFSPTRATAAVQALEQSVRSNELENVSERFATLREELTALSSLLHQWMANE